MSGRFEESMPNVASLPLVAFALGYGLMTLISLRVYLLGFLLARIVELGARWMGQGRKTREPRTGKKVCEKGVSGRASQRAGSRNKFAD